MRIGHWRLFGSRGDLDSVPSIRGLDSSRGLLRNEGIVKERRRSMTKPLDTDQLEFRLDLIPHEYLWMPMMQYNQLIDAVPHLLLPAIWIPIPYVSPLSLSRCCFHFCPTDEVNHSPSHFLPTNNSQSSDTPYYYYISRLSSCFPGLTLYFVSTKTKHYLLRAKKLSWFVKQWNELIARCCVILMMVDRCCTTKPTTTSGQRRILWLYMPSIAIATAIATLIWLYFAADRVEQPFLRLDVRGIWVVFWLKMVDQEDVRGLRWCLVVDHDVWQFTEWVSDHILFTKLIDLWLILTPLRKSRWVWCTICSGLSW